MKVILAILTSLLLLTGCTGLSLDHKQMGSFHNIESKSVGALDPSLKTVITILCMEQPNSGHFERFYVDNAHQEEIICNGHFVFLDKNSGQQTGFATGVTTTAIEGGAMAGTGYFVYKGLKASGDDNVTNNTNSSAGGDGGQGGEGFGMSSSNSTGGTAYGFGGSSSSNASGGTSYGSVANSGRGSTVGNSGNHNRAGRGHRGRH